MLFRSPNSFYDTFGTDEIRTIEYDYEMLVLEDEISAIVSAYIKINVGNKTYTSFVYGDIYAYTLPSEDVFWEGALDGSMDIDNSRYNVIVAFAKLESSEEVMMGITIDNGNAPFVAISFGNNLINGEVKDFLLDRASVNNEEINAIGIIENDSNFFGNPPDASVMVIDPNPSYMEDISDGMGTGSDIGENGEYKYQSLKNIKHEASNYTAYQSGVYFDKTKNLLMVTVKPFSSKTQSFAQKNYVDEGGYDFVQTTLYSLGIELVLTDVPGANYAFISNIDKPQATVDINNFYNDANVLLRPLFDDILSLIGVPTSTISAIFNSLRGKVVANDSRLIANIDIRFPLIQLGNPNQVEDLEHGLPIRFQLAKGSSSYIGDTPYTVNTYVVYRVTCQVTPFLSEPQTVFFFITSNATHEGVLDLG